MDNKSTFSCKNSFCHSLDDKTRCLLCKKGIRFSLGKKQELLFSVGEGQVLLIEQGYLITLKQKEDGKQVGIEIISGGDMFGIAQVFDPTIKRFIVARPLNLIKGCMFSVDVIRSFIKYPDFSAAVVKNLGIRLANCIEHIEHIATGSSKNKVSYIFEKLKSLTGTIPCTHEEIALLAGVNRVTATKELGKITSL